MLYKDFVREKTHHLTRIKSAEGYPCVFDDSKGKALKNYKVYGKSIQNGTPTPESPVEIESVGNKSKNLLNVVDYFSDFLDANGNIVFNQSNFTSITKLLLTDKFKENTQYTLSCTVEISNANSNGIVFHFYDSSGTSLASYTCTTTGSNMFKVKITNKANTTIKYARIVYGSSSRRCDAKISNFQIEEGSSVTNYIPYGKYGIPIIVDNKSKNIFGGIAFRNKLMELGGILNEKNKTVTIAASSIVDKVLFDKFDANKRYTFIFRGYNTNTSVANHPSNIKINYSGGTIQNGYFNSTPGTKGTWYYKSTEGLSISNFMGVWNTSSTVFYYEECGIFEGAISESEFEPYSITQTDIFLNAPLRKFSTYSDYIDFKRQKVVRRVGYFKRSADTLKSLTNSVISYATSKPNSALGNGMSTIGSYSAKYGYTNVFHWYVSDAGNLFLFAPTKDITLGEYFTNLDIQTDVEFIWATSASTEEAVELPSILTLKNNNIITTNTAVTASNIEVKYVAK